MNFSIPGQPAGARSEQRRAISTGCTSGTSGGQMWSSTCRTGSHADRRDHGDGQQLDGETVLPRPATTRTRRRAGEYYPTQAIYGGANAALDANTNIWIYFGTGDRNHPNNTAANRFYGIKDTTTMTNGRHLDRVHVGDRQRHRRGLTTASTVPQGWYYLLSSTDKEKVLASADVFNKIVFFTSFKPSGDRLGAVRQRGNRQALCRPDDHGLCRHGLGERCGLRHERSGGGGVGSGGTRGRRTTERGQDIGAGIPSKPVITLTDTGIQVYTASLRGQERWHAARATRRRRRTTCAASCTGGRRFNP